MTALPEPDRGPRKWAGKKAEQSAVYGNRRRIRGVRGKSLLKQRGEKLERSFAHLYETGGMRRTHLRKHENILKRLVVHAGGFNLSLILRRYLGVGTPRGLQGSGAGALEAQILVLLAKLAHLARQESETDRYPNQQATSEQISHPRCRLRGA